MLGLLEDVPELICPEDGFLGLTASSDAVKWSQMFRVLWNNTGDFKSTDGGSHLTNCVKKGASGTGVDSMWACL